MSRPETSARPLGRHVLGPCRLGRLRPRIGYGLVTLGVTGIAWERWEAGRIPPWPKAA